MTTTTASAHFAASDALYFAECDARAAFDAAVEKRDRAEAMPLDTDGRTAAMLDAQRITEAAYRALIAAQSASYEFHNQPRA